MSESEVKRVQTLSDSELEARREKKRVIYNRWYANNREKKLAIVKDRSEAMLPELREYQKQYRQENQHKLSLYYAQPVVSRRKNAQQKARMDLMSEEERAKLYRDQHRHKREAQATRPRPEACEVCGGSSYRNRALSFDHDHIVGHFRGWLCGSCNVAIGLVKDDPKRLEALAAYLRSHGCE